MEPKTTRLTPLLRELEELTAKAGAPFSARALPGLSEEQIDDLFAPTGLAIPTELREWWRWHPGSRGEPEIPFADEIGPGWWVPMTIPDAIDDATVWREAVPADGAKFGWRDSWLPFAGGMEDHRRLVARLDESSADEVCVGHWFVGLPPEEPVERSLADVVQTWITAIGEGYSTWDGLRWVSAGFPPGFPAYVQL